MTSLRRRIIAAERAMRQVGPGIISIIFVNNPDGLDVDDGESWPSGRSYTREPQQTVEEFRDLARAEAQRLGEHTIIFGEQEPRGRIKRRQPFEGSLLDNRQKRAEQNPL